MVGSSTTPPTPSCPGHPCRSPSEQGAAALHLPPISGDDYDRPVVREDGTVIRKANVPLDEVWYVVWCTDSRAKELCSPRTLLIDPSLAHAKAVTHGGETRRSHQPYVLTRSAHWGSFGD